MPFDVFGQLLDDSARKMLEGSSRLLGYSPDDVLHQYPVLKSQVAPDEELICVAETQEGKVTIFLEENVDDFGRHRRDLKEIVEYRALPRRSLASWIRYVKEVEGILAK